MPFIRSTSRPVARLLAGVVVLGALALPSGAGAAPFCMINQGMSPQCIYYDANECRRDATRQGAACAANARELELKAGFGKYCVITSARAYVCAYLDRNTCEEDAVRQQGACVDSPELRPIGTPNPFSAIEGR